MHLFDINSLAQTIGLLGIFTFIFAESGLFFGFFLPGDSLLFTAGVLASAGYFDVGTLFLGCFLFAVLGDSVGYVFGKKIGPKIFSKPDSFFWKKGNIEKTQKFFHKHGDKTITLARFVPIVRTFAPIMAGVGSMPYRQFIFWNILGGFLWTSSMIFAGYFLGNTISDIDKYILPIIFFIIVISFIPVFYEIFRNRRAKIKNDTLK